MGCCSHYGCDEFFGERFARRTARLYRARGLEQTATRLYRFLAGRGGESALEIGGGVGALVVELVRGGVARGELVEVVPGYEPFARRLFREAGVEVEFRLADLVTEPNAAEKADLVALNKVVCCTPDGPALVAAGGGGARRGVAFGCPRNRGGCCVAARIQNPAFRLERQ
ncbi:hypothetical protein BH18ACT13_BH18ACT13_21620 [soil metagenome]